VLNKCIIILNHFIHFLCEQTDIKDGQGGKVSSIRIRKKIPKPQNNLTPMGLPKVIRCVCIEKVMYLVIFFFSLSS